MTYQSTDGPNDRDEGIDLGLDNEPGSLLDFLQTRQEVVKRSGIQLVPGLSLRVEVTLYNCLILHLYRK